MNKHWIVTEETLLGFKCLRHRITNELCLFGLHGEIWLKNSMTCKAIVRNRKSCPVSHITGLDYHKQDEAVIEFPATEIEKYMRMLGVAHTFSTMQNYSRMVP